MIFCGSGTGAASVAAASAVRGASRGPGALGELPQLPGVERRQQPADARGGAQRRSREHLLADEHPARRLSVGDQAYQSHR